MTVTFAADLTTKEAQRKLANFKRRVLKDNFGHAITVREFTARGRPHFHLVIDCQGDISTGYNWEHHDSMTAWSKTGRKGVKPHGSLNRSPRLKELHDILNEKAPLYGLGRLELVPVKKPEAIAFYLGAYLAKSLANKPADAKGTRAVNYSHRCPRVFSGSWSWANPAGWVWRAKLGTWARKHGCASFPEVKGLFGPRWAYHHREAILATQLDYYPTANHAAVDGLHFPEGSTDIRFNRFPDEKSKARQPSPDFKIQPAPCITQAHRDERQRLAAAWLARHSSAPCDSSQDNVAESSPLAKRMFPPEERFEEKRGSPLVSDPVGDSKSAEHERKREYRLQSPAERDRRKKVPQQHYQRALRLGPLREDAQR